MYNKLFEALQKDNYKLNLVNDDQVLIYNIKTQREQRHALSIILNHIINYDLYLKVKTNYSKGAILLTHYIPKQQ